MYVCYSKWGGQKVIIMHQSAMKKGENEIPTTDWEREVGEDKP